jgi:hypothetical protein
MSYARFAFPNINARGANNQNPLDNDFDGVPVPGAGALVNGLARGLAVTGALGTITGTMTDGSTFSLTVATANRPILIDVASITSLGTATGVYALY